MPLKMPYEIKGRNVRWIFRKYIQQIKTRNNRYFEDLLIWLRLKVIILICSKNVYYLDSKRCHNRSISRGWSPLHNAFEILHEGRQKVGKSVSEDVLSSMRSSVVKSSLLDFWFFANVPFLGVSTQINFHSLLHITLTKPQKLISVDFNLSEVNSLSNKSESMMEFWTSTADNTTFQLSIFYGLLLNDKMKKNFATKSARRNVNTWRKHQYCSIGRFPSTTQTQLWPYASNSFWVF